MADLMKILAQVRGVITDSHFVYTSGKHGRAYVNWVAVLRNSAAAREAARSMATLVWERDFDTVAGPTHTGDKVASDLGLALLDVCEREVARVYAQETGQEGQRIFPRSQEEDVSGKRVLVVDDVLTTGKTVRETVEAVQAAGGEPIGVLVGCNRSVFKGTFDGLPLLALLTVDMEQWDPEECRACIEQVTMNTSVVHSQKFLDEYGSDPENWPANRK